MITTILSGLALLVVIADLILTVREKKRGEERNAAFEAWKDSARDTVLHYIDSEIKCVGKRHDVFAEKIQREMQDIKEQLKDMSQGISLLDSDFEKHCNESGLRVETLEQAQATIAEKCADIEKRLHDLEQGVVPDYSEALAAKNAVDEFSKGLSAILNYDPIDAYRKEQERNKYGVEVE